MKTIGLIGGMSWESTATYYRRLNELVKARLGGLHSARIALYSVDFHEVERLQSQERWKDAAALMIAAAQRVEHAGADLLLLCTNTMHRVAEPLQAAVRVPLVHIGDPVADAVHASGLRCVGLLGTRFTMAAGFLRDRIEHRGDLRVIVPAAADRERVDRVIFEELCQGRQRAESRAAYRRIIAQLVHEGAQGIILGCTEIGLLIRDRDATVPLFDTTELHCARAVELALEGEPDASG